MKALIMRTDRSVAYSEIKEPVPGDGEVLIKVEACGICGTDMHVYRGMDCTWSLPGVTGHEFSGTVLGTGADAADIKIGDRVTVQPLAACGACPRCLEGRTNLCPEVRLIGGEKSGAFAEKVIVPAGNVIIMPDGLPLKYGALAEPAATAVHAVSRLRMKQYDTVLIKGAGAVGLLILSCIRTMARTVIISDIDESRLKTAEHMGADWTVNPLKEDLIDAAGRITGQKMADVVVDAAGEPGGRAQALQLLHAGGELLLAALGHTACEIDFARVITQEITIHGTQCHTVRDFETALQLMKEGRIPYEKIVTELPLKEGVRAFQSPDMGIKIHLFPQA